MKITLTEKDYIELLEESEQNSTHHSALEPFEYLHETPKQLGKGYYRAIEVYPEFWLDIFDREYNHDMLFKIPVNHHPLQFGALAVGTYTDTYGKVGEGHTFIAGGGLQRKIDIFHRQSQRTLGIYIEMPPQLLRNFFPGVDGEIASELRFLAKDNDWQTLFYPQTTPAIQGVVQQIINCPYQGITKRMYLQAKALELITLQLAPFLAEQGKHKPSPRLKATTIARIQHAREILLSRLENPPPLLELAQLVGVSATTLKRGFKILFGTSVFAYLTDKRMAWAEQLLRQNNSSVAEVANLVGYSHLGHFAAAFKQRYGITPSQCLLGKKVVSG
ncbi:AraC family transcriptional regulator [Chlorogloeopsis sp. ULAP02]|uniref:helix-turn-helix transcriptional regulator n=1 Tax=Chlorogloeopsis sp. ULAP02 TaxID=3107926 RepID=UPI00313473D7